MTAPRVVISRHTSDMSSTAEVARGGDRECKANHEGDVLLLENDAEQDRYDTKDDCRDLGDPDFIFLVRLAALDHRRIEIVADRRCARQGQPRHDREDRGESHRRDEAEEDIPANRGGEMNRRHVRAAPDSQNTLGRIGQIGRIG